MKVPQEANADLDCGVFNSQAAALSVYELWLFEAGSLKSSLYKLVRTLSADSRYSSS